MFITDVYRLDPESTHNYQRAFDARVFYSERGDNIMTTITELEWRLIGKLMGKILEYAGTRHSLIVVHGEGDDRHAHNQVGVNYPVVKI